jgi:hypothetical protein
MTGLLMVFLAPLTRFGQPKQEPTTPNAAIKPQSPLLQPPTFSPELVIFAQARTNGFRIRPAENVIDREKRDIF